MNMKIKINDEEKIVSSSEISQLLLELEIPISGGIAVAVNDNVVSRKNWDSFKIKENDNIIIITATRGG